ncbi:MAG: gfo/Idh/MocA family oxidoreductase, partial [Kiritimatiellaeota bacterium]|nr:gfo/Idh/MocA family oxidoreductase [Kiritimatiellota bacterium]
GKSYHIANEYIRSGQFGAITYVDLCWNVNQPKRWRRGDLPAQLKESDTNWKMWLLDRPAVSFDPRKYLEFRLFWPYSSGIPGQWMCHQIDTVAWFTGCEFPRSAMAGGGLYAWKDGRENGDTFTTILEYGPEHDPAQGFQVVFSSRQTNSARGNVEKYYSAKGTIDLIRGTVSNEGVEGVKEETKKLGETEAASTAAATGAGNMEVAHMRNWMECVRSRKQPNAPIEAGYSHAVALIMSNASLRTGMQASFDRAARQVLAGGKVFKGY